MQYHESYNSALLDALRHIGRDIDPETLRARAKDAGVLLAGISSGRVGHDLAAPSLSGLTGKVVHYRDDERMPELTRQVDNLMSADAPRATSKRSART